jgi:hypothetical protein
VEFGSAPGQRKAKNGTLYRHPGSRAQPYLLPAWNKHKKHAFTLLKAATLKALERTSAGAKDWSNL